MWNFFSFDSKLCGTFTLWDLLKLTKISWLKIFCFSKIQKQIQITFHIIKVILIFQLDDHVLMKLDFLQMVGELVTQYHAIIQMEHQQMAIQLSSNALEAKFLLDLQVQHVKMVHGVTCPNHVKVRKLKCIHHGQIWLVSTIESIVKLNNQHIFCNSFLCISSYLVVLQMTLCYMYKQS